jgi:peptide/nickel transport system permease protein
MRGYIVQRFLGSIGVIFGLLVFVFLATHYIGNPLYLLVDREVSTVQDQQRIIEANGFDRPFQQQFIDFFAKAAHGDFGESILQNRPATAVVFERINGTLLLTGTALLTTFLIAIPTALVAVHYNGRWPEIAITIVSTALASVASFWLALGLIFVLAVKASVLPTSGYGSPKDIVLPTLALSLPAAGQLIQVIHASLLNEYRQAYVVTARAKGLVEQVVMLRHVLRNTAIVTITLLGSMLAGLLNGTVLIETIFAWPGLGQVGLQAVEQRDLPVLMVTVLYTGVIVTVINLLIDIAYGYLDPRVRAR